MPLLQITTNSTVIDAAQLAKDASQLTATMLGKPESYVMVHINANASLCFAGTNEACAHLQLKSLGLNQDETKTYSRKLCQFIAEQLGITESRIYIEFSSPDRHMWGWDSGTF